MDVTVSVKLYALELTSDFLRYKYSKLSEQERLALRQAVLTAARQYAPFPYKTTEVRILGNKLASLLAGLIVREFPQRWSTLMNDVFTPVSQGGLWYSSDDQSETVGVKICLECLKLVAEDCTDSDFNTKVCTENFFISQEFTVNVPPASSNIVLCDFHVSCLPMILCLTLFHQ